MNDPNLYSSVNLLPIRDIKYVIKNYFQNVNWLSNGGDLSLDIGCGDGGITREFLLTSMPNTAEMLIGCDISQEMIKHAAITHQHPKLQFRQLDIGIKSLPKEFIGKFDHIFSHFCLHWIQDQRHLFQNIYDLLKPNGDILVAYLSKYPVFPMYESISKLEKWKAYMTDYRKYVSPFYKSLYPEKEVRKILTSIGFEVNLCKCVNRTYVFEDYMSWRKQIKSINPFINRIPESDIEEYIDEYVLEHEKRDLIIKTNNKTQFNTPYTLIIVSAKKINP